MCKMLLTAIGFLAVAGVASAQPSPAAAPPRPLPLPQVAPATVSPASAAASSIIPAGGGGPAFRGDGCASGNCGAKGGFTMSHVKPPADNCMYGYPCQNGCGGVRSDLAFHFGSCKNFFAPCGPTWGGAFGHKCPTQPYNTPWGQGWQCPRGYDSYTNH